MINHNDHLGFFIAVDGPNGAGKSTLISEIKKQLEIKGYNTFITREPTESKLGNYLRDYAETHKGISVACLVAADRYEHITNDILPALHEGKIVITDRYILSSLILQVMDGVSSDYILSINSNIVQPDLQLVIFADEMVLQKRLSERDKLTRFEKGTQSKNELSLMEEGIEILKSKGIDVLSIDNSSNLNENVTKIISYIVNRCKL